MSKVSPLAPLLDIHTLPLDKADISVDQVGYGTPDVDVKFLQLFDAAWHYVMKERGSFTGKHESKITLLQNIAVKLKKSKDVVKSELKRQTLFVRNNRDTMESKFEHQIQEAKNLTMIMDEKIKQEKNLIHKVMTFSEASMHWHHFITELDKIVTTPNLTARQSNEVVASDNISYNDRAMRLIFWYHDKDGKQNEVNLAEQRAKVENALLKSQLKMLKFEIDRCKATILLQQGLASKLKDINNA